MTQGKIPARQHKRVISISDLLSDGEPGEPGETGVAAVKVDIRDALGVQQGERAWPELGSKLVALFQGGQLSNSALLTEVERALQAQGVSKYIDHIVSVRHVRNGDTLTVNVVFRPFDETANETVEVNIPLPT